MSTSIISRRKPDRSPSKNGNRCLDRLGPRLRLLRLENLEPRRLLSVYPFSAYANNLETKLAAIQTTLDTALDAVSGPLKSLPFIGPQLGEVDQIKAVIDNVGTQIQTDLTAFSNAVRHGERPSERALPGAGPRRAEHPGRRQRRGEQREHGQRHPRHQFPVVRLRAAQDRRRGDAAA